MSAKKILSIDDLSDGDVNRLFFRARSFLDKREYPQFTRSLLLTAFFEPSTRTRLSFEIAAHRLGMRVGTFHKELSSMEKGETLEDTLDNLQAMAPDILVIRQATPLTLSLKMSGSIINGGDGSNEHPTQALLDCFTLLNYFRIDDFSHKKILIIGDIAHSRVAHSSIKLMKRLNAKVILLASKGMCNYADTLHSFDDVDKEVDVVMCLRVQKERLKDASEFNQAEFIAKFCLTEERFNRLGKHCVVLHPGPMNKDVEISKTVAFHPRSLIEQQVKNGVLLRAALMEYCLL